VSPTLLLGLVLALIGAQLTLLASPRRLRYPVLLGLAVLGVVAGEVVSRWLHATGPALGSLHPAADLVGMAVAEIAGALAAGPGQPHRGP
jgi:hypothetical protein